MNARERNLALALAAVLLIAGGWVGFMQMAKWKKDLERREFQASLDQTEADALLKQKDFWKARSDMLRAQQPVWTSRKVADDEIYNLITESSKSAGVTLLGRQPQAPQQQPGLWAVGIAVEVKGPMEKVLRWLYQLQSPSAFVTLNGFSIKPDQEDTSQVIVSDLLIQKWYSDTGAPPPAAPADAHESKPETASAP